MNRGNFAIEHQQEAESFPYGTRDLPHLSVDITHDTRMPYGTKHLRVMPEIAHNYGKGVTVSREPPRDPPADGRVAVGADGTVRGSYTSPEQKIILQNALGYANRFAETRQGWQFNMLDREKTRFLNAFRQSRFITPHPLLLRAVNEHQELVKQLAEVAPPARVEFIQRTLAPAVEGSLMMAIGDSGRDYDAVFNEIKRSYGGAAAPVPTEPTSCGFRGRGGVRPPNEANYVGRLKTTSGKRARKSEDYREQRREYLNSLTPSQRLQNWAYENQLPDLLGARTADQQREYNRLQQEVTRIEQVIADLRADPNLTAEQAEEAEEEIMGDLDYLFDDAPVSTDETDEDGVIDKAPRQGDEEDSDDDDDPPLPPYRPPAISVGAGAAPVPTEPTISPFAAAATALQPIRTAIQNGIGDAIYGKEDDPKKQRKGLLGISEEGKEESKKKVMKNIVVPIAKVAMELKQDVEDTANMLFNKDKYESDMKARKLKKNLAWERGKGIVRDKTDDMLIVRKPRGIWTGLTSNPQDEAYAFGSIGEDDKFYVRVPNPLFGIWEKINKKPSYSDFKKFGILLPWSVQARGGETITKELEDEFIFLPEEGVKEFYAKLTAWGRSELDKTPEGIARLRQKGVKELLSKDPRTLKGNELRTWKLVKAQEDKKTVEGAKTKVEADIKAEEAKETPDTEKLAKMKAAKERVLQKEKEMVLRGQEEFKRSDEYKAAVANAKKDAVAASAKQKAESAEYAASKPVAERIADLESYAHTYIYPAEKEIYKRQMDKLLAEQAEEKAKEQAQGSVDLLQQAQVVGGGLMDCFRGRRRNRVLPVEPLPIEPPYITTPQPEPENPYGRPIYTAPPPPPPPPGAAPASPALPNAPQVSGQFTPATRLPPPRPVVGVPASQPLGCNQQHIDIINDALVIALKILDDSNYTSHFNWGLGYTPLRGLFREGGEGVETFLEGLADAVGEEGDTTPEAISYIGRKALEICRELIQYCQRRRIDPMEAITDIRDNTLRRARERRGRGVGGAKPTNPALYEKAKAIVNKSYPKHSAYRSGAYVKKYKEMGGEYEDEPDGKRPLERWFKEDWKDVGNKEYPVYRPTKRISKDTPLTPEEIDPENLKLQVKEKQKIRGERNLSAFQKRGGEGGEDDDDDDDEDEKEEVEVDRIDMGKGLVYLVDAPHKKNGKRVGLPFSSFKRALGGLPGIGNRRVWDAETKEELGILSDPIFKKLAMKVYKMEEKWRQANLDEIGVELGIDDLFFASGSDDEDDGLPPPKHFVGDGMEGSGAVEYTLQKAGKSLFNPSGDRSKAGKQSFTPDYEAYGASVAEGRKNAFNLSRSMYNQSKGTELPDFKLVKDDTTIRFYRKNDENVILVGIRGTDVKSWTDLYTWAVIGASQDLQTTARFQGDLAKLVAFQKNYPPSQFYYVAAGHSLAGSIADRFLELGLIKEAITYNPSIEKKFVLDENIRNHRVYLDTDPLFILMGQYAPNTEIRVNPNKTNYYNPIKEKDYLISSHTISPSYNSAFEGGGMEGSGKTYTIEEWKAIFDAKLEEKRKAIEAREAKKKQTAKAKRERAKARRDGRDEPPPLETPFRTSRTMKATPPKEPEPEEEEPEVEVDEYEMGDETYFVEAPREGLAFAERRVFDSNSEEIGNLTEDDVGKTLVKMVMRQEKLGAFADKSPKAKSSSESLPFFESKKPKEPEPEDDDKYMVDDIEVTEYLYRKKGFLIEDPKGEEDMNLEFYANRRVFDNDEEELGKLGDDNPLMKGLMKLVIKQEFPSQKDYRETMGLAAKKPRASKAPASARVELREELVAEQPRSPAGEFAKDAEPLQLVVSEVKKQLPQRDYMKLMKSPAFTGAERRLLGLYLSTPPITSRMRTKLMARSGLARKLMELLGIDESAFQTRRDRLKIADTVEKRVATKKAQDIELAPIMDLFDKQEAGLIRFMATLTGKKDGNQIMLWINQVARRFADAAIGTWVVAERILEFGRSDGWSCDGRNDLIERPAKVDESSGGRIRTSAFMYLTEADEKNVTCMGFVAGKPRFGLNFSAEKTGSSDNFFFPQMTKACMKMVEKIDGVEGCDLGTRKAGMGYKRRREWRFICKEVEPEQQRLKPEQKKKIADAEAAKMKEIAGKVGALVAEYKDIILERGELMVKRVVASLTPQQKKLIGQGMKGE